MPHFDDPNDATQEKSRNANPFFKALGWALMIVTVYILSSGPALWWMDKYRPDLYGYAKFYSPVDQLYWRTPLKRPLGIYWHLWRPFSYAANGDYIWHPAPD